MYNLSSDSMEFEQRHEQNNDMHEISVANLNICNTMLLVVRISTVAEFLCDLSIHLREKHVH
jgi:hypothetical protein